MPQVLHLGVLDVGYGQARKTVKVAVETTGQVAEWLERKYHIFEHFWEMHGQKIADALAQSLADSIADIAMGAPVPGNPLQAAGQDIETMFRQFLSRQELDSLGYPGIPTLAAQKGVNHRLKHPYAKGNPPRPSFIDTGLYQASFKVWMD